MLLTITSTSPPADDLSFLLHKHPDRLQQFEISCGLAHVFYPECSHERCTAALLLELDPVGLVRRPGAESGPLQSYINDRPYVASSHLSVAIAEVFGTALNGKCKERPALVELPLALEARLSALSAREEGIRRVFQPLGYEVAIEPAAVDPRLGRPQPGCFAVTLRASTRLCDLLGHLYVLIPALDDEKHYFIGRDEVDKLLRRGEGWLRSHPEREFITQRFLRHRREFVRSALAQLEETAVDPEEERVIQAAEELQVEERIRLHDLRHGAVQAVLRAEGAQTVLDLGCGEGKLLSSLLADRRFTKIVGVDVSHVALERAARKLHLDRMPPAQRERLQLLHGSLIYRDRRLTGFDAACLIEVIEHCDPSRLRALERVVLEFARPRTVIVTTPNREYNALFPELPAGKLRHRDHRFEWTRAEFHAWADHVAVRFGCAVRFLSVGPVDDLLGSPTQMAVFTRT